MECQNKARDSRVRLCESVVFFCVDRMNAGLTATFSVSCCTWVCRWIPACVIKPVDYCRSYVPHSHFLRLRISFTSL